MDRCYCYYFTEGKGDRGDRSQRSPHRIGRCNGKLSTEVVGVNMVFRVNSVQRRSNQTTSLLCSGGPTHSEMTRKTRAPGKFTFIRAIDDGFGFFAVMPRHEGQIRVQLLDCSAESSEKPAANAEEPAPRSVATETTYTHDAHRVP